MTRFSTPADVAAPIVVESEKGLTLVGSGAVGIGDLSEALYLAPDLVAADGGAAVALGEGHTPLAVIGDMDSLHPGVKARLPEDVLRPVEEQDSTDFDKVLARVRAPFALGVGFLGGRVDHQMAGLNALARLRHMPCLLLGQEDVIFAAPPELAIRLAPGTRVSLFPFAEVEGTDAGLHWPIAGLRMSPAGLHGTSNRMAEGAEMLRLKMSAPGLLVILPRHALRPALTSLRAAPLWPVPAPAR